MLTLCLTWLLTPRHEDRLTLNLAPVPVAAAMRRLSEVSKLKVKANPEVELGTLAIHFNDRKLEEGFDRIAEALRCVWMRSDDRVTFFLTAKEKKKQEKAESDAKLLEIKAALEKLPKLPEWSEEEAKTLAFRTASLGESLERWIPIEQQREIMADLRAKNPGGRALRGLMELIDLRALADLGVSQTAVYSTKPNRLQRPMPSKAFAVIKAYDAQYAAIREELKGSLSAKPSINLEDPRRAYSDESTAIDRVLFTAKRSPRSLIISMAFLDAGGNQRDRPFLVLAVRPEVTDDYKPKWEPIPASPDLVELVHLNQRWQDHSERFASLRQDLSQPHKRDPLNYIHGYLLREVAKREEKDLVAWIPDISLIRAFSDDLPLMASPTTAPQFAKMAQSGWACVVNEQDDCLVISPQRPIEARAGHLNRDALALVFGEFARDRRLSLETAADYAVRQKGALRYLYERSVCLFFTRAANNVSDLDLFYSSYGAMLEIWDACRRPLSGTLEGQTIDAFMMSRIEKVLLSGEVQASVEAFLAKQTVPDITDLLGRRERGTVRIETAVNPLEILFHKRDDRTHTEAIDECYMDLDDMRGDDRVFTATGRRLKIRLYLDGYVFGYDCEELPKLRRLDWMGADELDPGLKQRARDSFKKTQSAGGTIPPF